MSEQLLKIGKELPHYSGVDFLPSSKNSLFALAQALGNAKSKEEKQKIIETVKAKTEEKGKPLTEKEIKEIFEQEQEKKIEQIKKMLQSNPSFTVDYLVQDSGLSLKIVQEVVFSFRRQKELNELSETVKIQKDANANLLESYQELKGISAEQLEEIENLNSIIAKLNVERKDLALKQAELDQQIKSEVNVKVEDLLQQERKELEAKIKQLEAKEQELNSQSKQLQSSLQDVEKVKSNLNNLNDWIATLNQFNHSLNEQTQYLIATWSKIQDLPDLDSLEESEREIANKKLSNVIGEFHAHSDKYARALGNFHGGLGKI